MEVNWIDDSTLVVKEVNRAADQGNVVFFDFDKSGMDSKGKVVRKLGVKGEEHDDGWVQSVSARMPFEKLLWARF